MHQYLFILVWLLIESYPNLKLERHFWMCKKYIIWTLDLKYREMLPVDSFFNGNAAQFTDYLQCTGNITLDNYGTVSDAEKFSIMYPDNSFHVFHVHTCIHHVS